MPTLPSRQPRAGVRYGRSHMTYGKTLTIGLKRVRALQELRRTTFLEGTVSEPVDL